MSALPKAWPDPSVVYLPPVADRKFLRNAVDVLEQLRAESEVRGHLMLASLLEIAKGEAEDGLRTQAKTERIDRLARVEKLPLQVDVIHVREAVEIDNVVRAAGL